MTVIGTEEDASAGTVGESANEGPDLTRHHSTGRAAPMIKKSPSKKSFGKNLVAPQEDLVATEEPFVDVDPDAAILDYGMYSNVGNPRVHRNEDKMVVVLDLLNRCPPNASIKSGGDKKTVHYFSVFDGHGGGECSEILQQKLHTTTAKHIYQENTDVAMGANLTAAYEEAESTYCSKCESGACAVTTVLRGRKLFTAACGDSMAMLVKIDPIKWRPDGKAIDLSDRHATYLSPQERARLKKAGAEVSQEPGIEDALVARKNGFIYKAIYPTRSFGDQDFKHRTRPIKGLIATPTGRGVGYEGPAVDLEGQGPWFLIVACDGLWDFMKQKDILAETFRNKSDTPSEIATRLVKVAQGKKFQSDDDVSVIVVKISYS